MTSQFTIKINKDYIPAYLESEWRRFLSGNSNANFFQSPEILSLYRGIRKYSILVFTAHNTDNLLNGVLVAVLIRERIKGIPFKRLLIQGGPVIAGGEAEKLEILDKLLQSLQNNVPRGTVFIEIRNFQSWPNEQQIFIKHGFIWIDHLNGILKTQSRQQVFNAISTGKQRQIYRGIEKGAIISPVKTLKEVREFYQLLVDLYTNNVKKPLPPFSFFRNFYKTIQAERKGVILVVKYNGKIISGMVCPFSAGHTVYEWYISSIRSEFKQLYPGVLATWAGIDYALQNKFKYFDFMGLGSPHQPYGVREFKKRFGGEITNFGRWHFVNNKMIYNLSKIGYKILKTLS